MSESGPRVTSANDLTLLQQTRVVHASLSLHHSNNHENEDSDTDLLNKDTNMDHHAKLFSSFAGEFDSIVSALTTLISSASGKSPSNFSIVGQNSENVTTISGGNSTTANTTVNSASYNSPVSATSWLGVTSDVSLNESTTDLCASNKPAIVSSLTVVSHSCEPATVPSLAVVSHSNEPATVSWITAVSLLLKNLPQWASHQRELIQREHVCL